MERLTVACCYWRNNRDRCERAYVYTPEDVYLLRNQCGRNYPHPHEFVVLTDRPGDFDSSIRTVPLDPRLHIPGGRYAKLAIFAPDAGEKIGDRILMLDLDTVIVGDMTPLVDRPEDLVLWRNPNFGLKRRAFYNTSIMLIRAGARPHIYAGFKGQRTHEEAARATGWGGTDQRYVSWQLGRQETHWTAADGVYGAGRLGDYCPGRATTELPDNARIVFFPGRRHPKMRKIQERHPWIPKFRW